MAIKIGNKKIAEIYKGSTPIKEVLRGDVQNFVSATVPPTLGFVSATQTSIVLSVLNNDPDNLTDIEISYGGLTFTQNSLSIGEGQTQNFTISSLDPNTSFDFIAIADANGKGFSENSNTISESTLAVQAPTINFDSATVNSLKFTFTNNNEVPANIRTTINSNSTPSAVTDSSTISVSNLAKDATSGIITFSGLDENSTYTIAAKADIGGNLSSQVASTKDTLEITYSISANDTTIDEVNDRTTTFNITTQNYGSGTLY